jgi:hypothetical protein
MAGGTPGVEWKLDSQRGGFARCYLREAEFEEAVRKSETGSEIETLFERTKPRWYGLWLEPLLTPAQCKVLLELYSAGEDWSGEVDPGWDIRFPLRVAVVEGIPLQVEATKPGHFDLGWVTFFVHCPRCKCEGAFPRWKDSYPTDPHVCECCGHTYSPASTYSQRSLK